MAESLKRIYAIDLGASNSRIACADGATGTPFVMNNAEGDFSTPSDVYFDEDDDVSVGAVAQSLAAADPDNVVRTVRRLLGDRAWTMDFRGKNFTPEAIAALILRKLVMDAEINTGDTITDVVLSVPACFGVIQREAMIRAAKLANLEVVGMINGPTAAAVFYGTKTDREQTTLVYDLGGGAVDVSIIRIKKNEITVIRSVGDSFLGGRDWDQAVARDLIESLDGETNDSDRTDENLAAVLKLIDTVEDHKKILTSRRETVIPVVYQRNREKVTLTRDRFDELTAPLLEHILALTQQMLAEANFRGNDDFDKILLVGGLSKMPQIKERLQSEFPDVGIELFDVDHAVVKGAAIFSHRIAIRDEVTRRIARITGQNNEDIIMDDVAKDIKSQVKKSLHNDLAVSPHVIEEAMIAKLQDVAASSIGIVALTEGGSTEVASILIGKNEPLQTLVTTTFLTATSDQTVISMRLVENPSASPSSELYEWEELVSAEMILPANLPADYVVEVSFRLTEEGRLEVTATGADGRPIQTELVTQ